MPQVGVGGSPTKVSWAEYALALMPIATLVEFDKKPGFPGRAQRGRMKMFRANHMTIRLDPKLSAQIDRALDFFEGKQQARIDALAAQVNELVQKLNNSGAELKDSVTTNS